MFWSVSDEWQTHGERALLTLMLNISAIIPPWWGFNANDTLYRSIYTCWSDAAAVALVVAVVAVVVFPLVARFYMHQLTNRSRSFSSHHCKILQNVQNTELKIRTMHISCSDSEVFGNVNKTISLESNRMNCVCWFIRRVFGLIEI